MVEIAVVNTVSTNEYENVAKQRISRVYQPSQNHDIQLLARANLGLRSASHCSPAAKTPHHRWWQ
jgi:hypothetical protein